MSIITKDEYTELLHNLTHTYEELVLKYSNIDPFRDMIKDAMLTYSNISVGTEEEYIFINVYIILYILGISTLSIKSNVENPCYDPSKTLEEQLKSLAGMFLNS